MIDKSLLTFLDMEVLIKPPPPPPNHVPHDVVLWAVLMEMEAF